MKSEKCNRSEHSTGNGNENPTSVRRNDGEILDVTILNTYTPGDFFLG